MLFSFPSVVSAFPQMHFSILLIIYLCFFVFFFFSTDDLCNELPTLRTDSGCLEAQGIVQS